MKIPLAEHFHSLQGEGQWTGTPMHFIRLPGCSVGKYRTDVRTGDPQEDYLPQEDAPKLPSGKRAWLCHQHDGKAFWCDTDFNKYSEMELSAILDETFEHHLCITGGEPLIHPMEVEGIICACEERGITVHIETSGTIMFDYKCRDVWVTCSPKQKFIWQAVMNANELKFLVDGPTKIPDAFFRFAGQIWLSPVNEITDSVTGLDSRINLDRCLEMLREHPEWRLSVQLHKYLGLR